MSRETFQIVVVVFVVWGLAVAIKALTALRKNEPYTFGMWDGGLLRMGKKLNRLGMQIKLVVGVLMFAGCLGLLTGLVPFETGSYAIMFVAIMSIVSDFVTASDS